MHAEIQAIARRQGWPEHLILEVEAAVDRILGRVSTHSVLATMDLWGASVSLEPAATVEVKRQGAEAPRYEDLGLLGEGGMGEVRRVRDRDLNRTMAMKIIRPAVMKRPVSLARFIEEAQATAQLQHPGIVPVHELGTLPDGRVYFTMQEVRGRTLGELIDEVHAASTGREWAASERGWTFRRLVDAFHRVCEAVAYAHARGVVHRDLKPSNVMVGSHGEVLVVDWGLAKVVGRPDLVLEAGDLDPVQTDRSQDASQATQVGMVAGTPAYMPPEQARGEAQSIDARSDVYALGAMLYELLSGRPPYLGSSARDVLLQVLAGPPQPPGRAQELPGSNLPLRFEAGAEEPAAPSGPALPIELLEACQKAMARAPGDRFPDALALAEEVMAWLEGAHRREQALAIVEQAQAKVPLVEVLRARAGALRAEAASMLASVKAWQPEEDKAAGWALEDEAAALDRQVELTSLAQEQLLAASLIHAPRLSEAHAALAARYRAEHEAAETARTDATRAEALLESHVAALPEDHPARPAHLRYLRGDGSLSLVSDPPGAEVLLHRYELHHRRLVPVFQRCLGRTPLSKLSLPMGSYLCLLRHPDRAEVQYPVFIGRGEHWDGVPPEGGPAHPVWLPTKADLDPQDGYVPAGWFWSGGDPGAVGSLPRRRLWVDGLVMRRFPVTNREYLAFLDELVAQGREEEALRHAPRERAGTAGEQGALIYGYEGGRFSLRPDADGDVWDPDWPVLMIDWAGAAAFAAWRARCTGRPWRLPGELEWEKAARGVDGRAHPWGDAYDPSWACNRASRSERPLPAPVESFPVDCSPFGVRGMAGNVRDWCADEYDANGPPLEGGRVPAPVVEDPGRYRVHRGGCWNSTATYARLVNRGRRTPGDREVILGLRLARSIP